MWVSTFGTESYYCTPGGCPCRQKWQCHPSIIEPGTFLALTAAPPDRLICCTHISTLCYHINLFIDGPWLGKYGCICFWRVARLPTVDKLMLLMLFMWLQMQWRLFWTQDFMFRKLKFDSRKNKNGTTALWGHITIFDVICMGPSHEFSDTLIL